MIRLATILSFALAVACAPPPAPSPRVISFEGTPDQSELVLINGAWALRTPDCGDGQAFLDDDVILMGHCGLSDQQVLSALSDVAPSGWRIQSITAEHFAARRAALDRAILDRETALIRERGLETFELPADNRFSFSEAELARAYRTVCDQASPQYGRCAPLDEYRWHMSIEVNAVYILFIRRNISLDGETIESLDCRRVQEWECGIGQDGPRFRSSTLP